MEGSGSGADSVVEGSGSGEVVSLEILGRVVNVEGTRLGSTTMVVQLVVVTSSSSEPNTGMARKIARKIMRKVAMRIENKAAILGI